LVKPAVWATIVLKQTGHIPSLATGKREPSMLHSQCRVDETLRLARIAPPPTLAAAGSS